MFAKVKSYFQNKKQRKAIEEKIERAVDRNIADVMSELEGVDVDSPEYQLKHLSAVCRGFLKIGASKLEQLLVLSGQEEIVLDVVIKDEYHFTMVLKKDPPGQA